MFDKLTSMINSDILYRIFALLILVFIIYLAVMQIYLRFFNSTSTARPVRYKYFRIYAKDLIKNTPSKRTKKFYANANMLTYIFNSLMLVVAVFFLYKMFGIPFI